MGHLSFVPLPVLLGHSNLMKTMTVHVTNKTTIFKMKLKILMLLSIILAFRRETSLQCAKRTAGYCFAFFMKYMKMEVPISWEKKKQLFFNFQMLSQTNHNKYRQETLCYLFYIQFSFAWKRAIFSIHTHSLSVQTKSVCGVGKCHGMAVKML